MKVLYRILIAIIYLLSSLPLRVHYLISNLLYYLLRYVVRYRLKVVRQNLFTSFPEKTEKELRKIER
ncbi:MAG: acetyltransferase, partial [Prevotella sp.]|nr:acetyltransferase [Prevotella sp.]